MLKLNILSAVLVIADIHITTERAQDGAFHCIRFSLAVMGSAGASLPNYNGTDESSG